MEGHALQCFRKEGVCDKVPTADAEGEGRSLDFEVGGGGPSLISVRKEVMSFAETTMEEVDQTLREKRREMKEKLGSMGWGWASVDSGGPPGWEGQQEQSLWSSWQ